MIVEVREILSEYTKKQDVEKKFIRNRHPSAMSYRYLKKAKSGQWITGYTPGFYPEENEEGLQDEKQQLKELGGIEFNVNDPNDAFLSLLKIELALPENRMPIYDMSEPLDIFKVRTAIAAGYIAPKKEEVGVGKFANTTYYFQAKELEDKKVKEISKIRLTAGAILSKNENERAWLIIQCFLSGWVVKPNYENDTLFSYLAKKLEDCKTARDAQELLEQFKRKNQEIESIFVAKKAQDLDVIKYDSITKEYIYTEVKGGGVTSLGTSTKEVETYLNNPNKGPVYAQVRKEVYSKFNIGK